MLICFIRKFLLVTSVVAKIAPIGTRTQIVSFESGVVPACPFPAGTIIVCRAVYLFVYCAHFRALPLSFISLEMAENGGEKPPFGGGQNRQKCCFFFKTC